MPSPTEESNPQPETVSVPEPPVIASEKMTKIEKEPASTTKIKEEPASTGKLSKESYRAIIEKEKDPLKFILLIGAILLGFSGLFFSVFLLQFPLSALMLINSFLLKFPVGVLMLIVSFALIILSVYGFVHERISASLNPSDIPSKPVPALYCDQCGVLISLDSRYCDHCGKSTINARKYALKR